MVKDAERVQAIKDWCDFMLLNQRELKKEYSFLAESWHGWNNGYTKCLQDLKEIIDSQIIFVKP